MRSPDRWAAASGPLLVLLYCVINAVKSVYDGALVQRISPEFLAFHIFLLAQIFYLAICGDRAELWRRIRASFTDVLALNVTTMLSWLAVLYALLVFEPAVTNAIIVGLIPSLTLLLSRLLRPQSPIARVEVVAAVGVLGSMIYLAVVTWLGSSATGRLSGAEFLLGMVACLLTAGAVAGNTVYTKRLSEAGMPARQMMACRFVLLIVVTAVIFLVRGSQAPYTVHNVAVFLGLSVVGVIGAVYLLQVGITRTEPVTVSLLFGSNIILTYGIQYFDARLRQSAETLAGVVLLTLFILLGAGARYRKARPRPVSAAAQ